MGRNEIDDEAEEAIFSIFSHTQEIQRRALRITARRFFNEAGIDEMHYQARGLLAEIEALAHRASAKEE